MRRIAFVIFLLLLSAQSIFAQHEHDASDGTANPVTLMPGMGPIHHPVSTKNAEAQAFFDQGLALSYAFNHDEAGRSFKKAVELDPDLAMGWWGLALILGSNYNMPSFPDREKAAAEAISKAKLLAPKASPEDQAYIAALSQRYTLDPYADYNKLGRSYRDAMHDLMKQYPDDLDAATLYAESLMDLHPWKLWTTDGKPTEETLEIIATLESVLKRNPDHTGANHLYIHAMEESPHPEYALPSAYRIGMLAPGAGHLVHMAAHIYIRTGDHEAAVQSNEKAAAADRAFFEASGTAGVYKFMYYSHNLHFLANANAMLGNFKDALAGAEKLEAHVRPEVAKMPMLDTFLFTKYSVLHRFGHWDEILAQPEPDPAVKLSHAMWRYVRGVAYAAKGKAVDAERELATLQQEREKIAPEASAHHNPQREVAALAITVLQERIAEAKYDAALSEKLMAQAVDQQEKLIYSEPPEWFYPLRESYGALLLRHGKTVEAEAEFRKDLDWNPRNGRSLFGLSESLKAQKKMEDAALVELQFKEAWKHADTKLTLNDF
jgi:tetratricopeptide (TPR) repeat protein